MDNPITEVVATQEPTMPGNEDTQFEKEKSIMTSPNVDIFFQVHKWKQLATSLQEGVISTQEHRKVIQDLRERWEEELAFQEQRKENMRGMRLKKLKETEDQVKTLEDTK
jgi:hypothetical protein